MAVGSRYVLHADGTVSLALAPYRTGRKALVIDQILSYSRLLGGSGLDEAASVAVDAAGNVSSPARPPSPGFPGASGSPGGIDLFVTKLDARGSTVLYSTYMGGSGIDEARGMTIDTLGNVYVVGSTTSTNFPTVSPRQATLAGASDGFLLRVSTTGGGLGFSTYFGGSDVDEVNAVAVDGARNMSCAGSAQSANFPLLWRNPGLRRRSSTASWPGSLANGTLTFSTYHGGNAVDTLDGIAVDPAGQHQHGRLDELDQPAGAERGAGHLQRSRRRVPVALRTDRHVAVLLLCFGGSRNDVGRAVAVLRTAGRSSPAARTRPTSRWQWANPAGYRRRARCLPAGGLTDRRPRVVDLLRRHAQRARPRAGAERGRHADPRRPDLLARHAADPAGAAAHRRQP